MQRTAGAQVSASRLSQEGADADVELGFLDDEEGATPGMLGEQVLLELSPHFLHLPYACTFAHITMQTCSQEEGTVSLLIPEAYKLYWE